MDLKCKTTTISNRIFTGSVTYQTRPNTSLLVLSFLLLQDTVTSKSLWWKLLSGTTQYFVKKLYSCVCWREMSSLEFPPGEPTCEAPQVTTAPVKPLHHLRGLELKYTEKKRKLKKTTKPSWRVFILTTTFSAVRRGCSSGGSGSSRGRCREAEKTAGTGGWIFNERHYSERGPGFSSTQSGEKWRAPRVSGVRHVLYS